MTRTRSRWLGALVLVLCAAWAPSANADRLPRGESLMFSLESASGTLHRHAGSRTRYDLVLRGVSPQVIWFADRPVRDSGQIRTRALFDRWTRLGFAGDPPNAVLSPLGGGGADSVAIELGRPRYAAATRTLRMAVRRIGGRSARGKIRSRFGAAALFIDNAVSPPARIRPPVNRNPIAVTPQQFVSEDVAANITLEALDPDFDPLTYTVITPSTHGTLAGVAPSLRYTPDRDFYGADSLTYRASDGRGGFVEQTVSITVVSDDVDG